MGTDMHITMLHLKLFSNKVYILKTVKEFLFTVHDPAYTFRGTCTETLQGACVPPMLLPFYSRRDCESLVFLTVQGCGWGGEGVEFFQFSCSNLRLGLPHLTLKNGSYFAFLPLPQWKSMLPTQYTTQKVITFLALSYLPLWGKPALPCIGGTFQALRKFPDSLPRLKALVLY